MLDSTVTSRRQQVLDTLNTALEAEEGSLGHNTQPCAR